MLNEDPQLPCPSIFKIFLTLSFDGNWSIFGGKTEIHQHVIHQHGVRISKVQGHQSSSKTVCELKCFFLQDGTTNFQMSRTPSLMPLGSRNSA
jgi:hypothetical protein